MLSLPDKEISFDELLEASKKINDHVLHNNIIRVVGSRSHMNQETVDYMEGLKNENTNVTVISKGSSLKFCLIAEGEADIYPRFAPTMEWDTAAAHAICNASGVSVISVDTNEELLYNKENLLNPWFICKR